MKISIFKNNKFNIGIDYSKNEDCIGVFDITGIEKNKLDNGGSLEIINNELIIADKIKTSDELLEEQKIIINQEFQASINQFSGGYSQAEIDSWDKKVVEAKKVLNLETSTFLEGLIIEGETVDGLATKILANSDLFSVAYINAERIKRQKLKDLETNI